MRRGEGRGALQPKGGSEQCSPHGPQPGYLQPAPPIAKPWRRALANQVGASIISLMRALANLIPNKKMVGGREGGSE